MAGLEGVAYKKSSTAVSKLPPVLVGGEMQEQIKELEKQLAKMKEKNTNLEQELITTKKSGGGGSLKEMDALRDENQKLMVRLQILNSARSDRS